MNPFLVVAALPLILCALGWAVGIALRATRHCVKLAHDLGRTRKAIAEWRDQSRMLRIRAERAEEKLATMTGERDSVIMELSEVRGRLIQVVDERNCSREICEGLLEENEAYRAELALLRGTDAAEAEMVN